MAYDHNLSAREHEDFGDEYKPPYWWKSIASKPRCEHASDPANVETVATQVGYSDSRYWWLRCRVCRKEFAGYLEG